MFSGTDDGERELQSLDEIYIAGSGWITFARSPIFGGWC
jgi:hypothetical protein